MPTKSTTFESFLSQYPLKPVHDYTFLGTKNSLEKPCVLYNGKIENWFDPAEQVPWIKESQETGKFDIELVDGFLPVLKYTYRNPGSNETCEMTAFAADCDAAGGICVFIRLVEQPTNMTRYVRLKDQAQMDAVAFENELQKVRDRWNDFFKRGEVPKCEDAMLLNACKASIVRAMITFTGKHSHYGLKEYAKKQHDGFPPTILALTNCLLDWGRDDLASEYLLYYFEHFVKEDGRFNYYGPSLAEYGQMLTLVRRLSEARKDREWLMIIRPKLERMCDWLWSGIAKSETGLLAGVPEADTRDQVEVYFHNNAWLWRGLRDTGPVLSRQDEERCEKFRKCILDAIESVTDRSVDPPFIPPVARKVAPFKSMVQDGFASYTNYRYWLELLSSGILSKEQMEAIIKYRVTHDGEVAGMTHFSRQADNWPIAEYASALLSLGHEDACRNVLYSHLASHVTPGTWSAYEQVSITPNEYRRKVADYCVPSQLVAPRILAWLSRK